MHLLMLWYSKFENGVYSLKIFNRVYDANIDMCLLRLILSGPTCWIINEYWFVLFKQETFDLVITAIQETFISI